jgi:heme/copper-type cytochrome/quinol oxidase subunit 2
VVISTISAPFFTGQTKKGKHMTSFNTIIFWGVAGITGVVSLLISYSIIRFQRSLAGKSSGAGSFRDNSVLGFFWTLVPLGILAVLLILSFQAMQF